MSAAIQSSFAGALLDRDRSIPAGLTSRSGPRPVRRFGVYRDNVAVGLIRALAVRFPATERIVGEAFFAAMAHDFVRQHPPRSPLLLHYGEDFPAFAERFEPAAGLPYLPDVMRLEMARGRAYHAADQAPLDPSMLAGLPAERLPGLGFILHPSASLIRSSHPIVTIWAMNAGESPLAPIENWVGEDALVVRPRLTVLVQRLPARGAAFLDALISGQPLGPAAEAAFAETADFDLAANLAGLLGAGAIVGIR